VWRTRVRVPRIGRKIGGFWSIQVYADIGESSKTETIEQKIKKLEEELQASKAVGLKSTNKIYGTGTNLEKFEAAKFHKHKNIDIKPQDRKPKKDEGKGE
jgi:hypothetical protein